MRLIPSLILYNPLESALLLWCVWLLRDKQYKLLKFNKKKFIIDCYILGTIFLFVQYPLNWIDNSTLYIIFNKSISFIVMPFILFLYNKKCSLFKSFAIDYGYIITLNFIVKILGFPFALNNSFIDEFKANIYIRAIQFGIILLILYGGTIMKKFLISMARRNIGKTIASTAEGYGEPKLSTKLQDEIKK